MRDQFNDFMLNVDVMNIQFDVDQMCNSAKKMGLDAGDLSEYGFDWKSSKCQEKTCWNPDHIKSYDDLINKSSTFAEKITASGSVAYKKAVCHPVIKQRVAPVVQFFWNLWPFDCFFGWSPISWFLNILFFPCCWCIFIPFYTFITAPWNCFFFIGLLPVFILAGPLICFDNSMFCCICNKVDWVI